MLKEQAPEGGWNKHVVKVGRGSCAAALLLGLLVLWWPGLLLV
jgi:hypothetical protein